MSTIRALSPSDSCSAGRDRRRRSFGATVRISSVCSNRSSRSRSRPRMVIVQRDESPVPLKLEDYLDGTTSDTSSPDSSAHEKDSPDSSVHEKDLGPTSVTLPQPFAPPSIAGPSEGRQMDKVWGADLPAVPAMKQASEVDEVDRNTPDNWVARDPELVRLTGKHPFNCEAKLDKLFDAGFLTPSSLFYVRNHGAVPRVDQEQAASWRLRVHGMVHHPLTLSIAELQSKLETVTLPITLVCAGNRRKEQNMVRKGLGFNWGAAGVSTALFTGVYLADLLELVKPKKGARHVTFEGADKLPNGFYGTSQSLFNARQRSKGHLVAWAMNGLPLEPDHGFPLRIVSPGQIGGRSVKWLTSIEVSHEESQHYLHFHDNKVLPMQLLPDQARSEEDWWMDPRYTIYDLNVQSAIAYPNHDETLPLKELADEATYDIKGYAYAGGGQRISRVEISLDDGDTWLLAHITYPEDLYRSVVATDSIYGTLDLSETDNCFAWCFWTFRCPVAKLKTSAVIMVRAMDSAMNMQPRDMYWNATSMLNNWWFRVAILHETSDDGAIDQLRFEHPTMAGVVGGGWMARFAAEGKDVFKPVFGKAVEAKSDAKKEPAIETMKKEGVDRIITRGELAEHANEKEAWFVVNGEVYEGGPFLERHPGGGESITLVAGEDASEDFMAIHSSDAKRQLIDFHIGTLEEATATAAEPTATMEADGPETPFLVKNRWKPATLESIETISHDSRLYRFKLAHPDQPLALPIGAHAYARLKRKVLKQTAEGESELVEGDAWVQRAYTPVSLPDARGFIDLLIKIYFPVDSFEGGKMTIGFNELVVGDKVEFKGPIGHFVWQAPGLALWKHAERRVRRVGMICGGSGVTPILQVLRGIFLNADDVETEVWLLNSNKEERDILCRTELDSFLTDFGHRYRLHYALSRPSDGWTGSKGRLNEKTLREHLPPPSEEALLLICGPDAMIHETVSPALTKLGWDVPSQLVVF